ncbi:MAG: DUF6063 family protein [Fusobacteriota bacterium]
MEYTIEDMKWAFKIFMYLIKNGIIPEDKSDYLYAYQKNEVRYIIEEIIEEEADCKIFSFGNAIYLTPGINNWFLGFSNEELKSEMGLRTNNELYLGYFTILCLLAKFYNSEDQNMATRQFLPIEELESKITEQIDKFKELGEMALDQQEKSLELNITKIILEWEDLPVFDEELKNLRRGRNNRISFILRIMGFLEKEELVQVLENREIRLLPKFEHMILKYYFHTERKEKILNLLTESGE